MFTHGSSDIWVYVIRHCQQPSDPYTPSKEIYSLNISSSSRSITGCPSTQWARITRLVWHAEGSLQETSTDSVMSDTEAKRYSSHGYDENKAKWPYHYILQEHIRWGMSTFSDWFMWTGLRKDGLKMVLLKSLAPPAHTGTHNSIIIIDATKQQYCPLKKPSSDS